MQRPCGQKGHGYFQEPSEVCLSGSIPDEAVGMSGQGSPHTGLPGCGKTPVFIPKPRKALKGFTIRIFVKVPVAPLRGLTHLEQEQDCRGSRRESSCWHGSSRPPQTPAGPLPAVQVHACLHGIGSHAVEDGFPSTTFWILGREAQVDMLPCVG